ncbi:MAG: hypothetical protein NVSMB22_00730 [Chloroflexota bacterium]
MSAAVPWTLASIAFVALIALVAGQHFGRSSLPTAAPEALPARAPDISTLSPAQRADRLFNRVMAYDAAGKRDSVQFFTPMALASYEMLGPLTLDQRYHLGRIAEIAGLAPAAKAQADTILMTVPTHLLGLALAARVAQKGGDIATQRSLLDRLKAAFAAESAKGRDEYAQHRNDITAALAAASSR